MTSPAAGLVPTTLEPGELIHQYRLLERIGEGGVGIVWKAEVVSGADGVPAPALVPENGVQPQLVALKTIRHEGESQIASIRREIEVVRRIHHPGIVRILDSGLAAGRPWFAMELLEGETLASCIERHHSGPHLTRSSSDTGGTTTEIASELDAVGVSREQPWLAAGGERHQAAFGGDVPALLRLVRQLCEPLAYLHGEGLVHRDLKPSNIWIRRDGAPLLMDFGLVWMLQRRDFGSREVLDIDAHRAGTLSYMAPEQAAGVRLDARADLYSLGCVMYEALTGRLPFDVRHAADILAAHRNGRPTPPSELADGIVPALDDLV